MRYKLCAMAVACFALGACAPTVWERPGTSPLQFSTDRAQCTMMAEGMTPDAEVGTVTTGKFGRDLAINAALGIVGGLAHAAAVNQKFDLCMQANGYVGHPAGTTPAPMAFGAAAPPPGAPLPIAPAPAMPVAAVAAGAPQPQQPIGVPAIAFGPAIRPCVTMTCQ